MRSLTPLPFFLLSSLLGITLLPFFLLPPKENRTSTRDDDRGPFPPSFSPPPSQRSFVFPSSFSENVIQQPAQTPFRFFPFSFLRETVGGPKLMEAEWDPLVRLLLLRRLFL